MDYNVSNVKLVAMCVVILRSRYLKSLVYVMNVEFLKEWIT
jgi:hypothetical protein